MEKIGLILTAALVVTIAVVASPVDAQNCARGSNCPAAVSGASAIAMQAELVWRPIGTVTLQPNRKLKLPRVGAVPGVYRFEVRIGECRPRYVGETTDIDRRFREYETRTSGTDKRVRESFAHVIEKSGATITVAVADGAKLCLGSTCNPADFSVDQQRILIERFAILADGALLNIDRAKSYREIIRRMFANCT
jgi:hypothetical protein